jgi:type I restriction enzyme S subunit
MAAILDKADELRCKRRMSLALLDSLADAHFLEMFGADSEDMRRPLIEAFAESPNYGSMIPPGATGTHLSLRVANIQNGRLTLADRKYIDLPSKETARHSVRDGDLLLARAIASIDHLGKCVIAAPGNEAWAFDSHLMRLRLNPEIMIPDFLKRWLSSPPGRAAFLRVARRSAVQFNVNTKEMAGLLVPMPPIGTQLTVLEVGAAVERQRERATYLLARLDALFASLEHRAFRGEL